MTGMTEKRVADFLHSLEPEEDGLLSELRLYAEEHNVPIVRRETESFLRTLSALRKPERVLEIGTAIGYSTIVLAESKAQIITIENYEKRIPVARENLRRAGLSDRVTLIPRDAGDVLKELSENGETFDLIFLDAAKGQYLLWLPLILRLLGDGSVLVTDNVLQENTVMESRYTVSRRDRTTHQRMREFLYEIKHSPCLLTSVLPVGDGVAFSVYHKPCEE